MRNGLIVDDATTRARLQGGCRQRVGTRNIVVLLLIVSLNALLVVATDASPPAPVGASTPSASKVVGQSQQQGANDDSDVPLTPQQEANLAATMKYRRRLEHSLRKSTSPRDWALSTQLMMFDKPYLSGAASPERAALLRKAAETAPKDRLVQWIWAFASPETSGCDMRHPCQDRARSLAILEPDNGAAWVPVIIAAQTMGDAAAVDNGLSRMAAANRYDEIFGDAVTAWVDVYHQYPSPFDTQQTIGNTRVDSEMVQQSLAYAEAASMSLPAYQRLIEACRPDKNPQAPAIRFENCGKAGRLMLNHATTLLGRMIGRPLLRMSGVANAVDINNARAAVWQRDQYEHLLSQRDYGDIAAVRDQLNSYRTSKTEIEAMQKQLRDAGASLTPPSDWQPMRDGKPISPLGEPPANLP